MTYRIILTISSRIFNEDERKVSKFRVLSCNRRKKKRVEIPLYFWPAHPVQSHRAHERRYQYVGKLLHAQQCEKPGEVRWERSAQSVPHGKNMVVQMKDRIISGKDLMSGVGVLQNFKSACVASGILDAAAIWLFERCLTGTTAVDVKSCLEIPKLAYNGHKVAYKPNPRWASF